VSPSKCHRCAVKWLDVAIGEFNSTLSIEQMKKMMYYHPQARSSLSFLPYQIYVTSTCEESKQPKVMFSPMPGVKYASVTVLVNGLGFTNLMTKKGQMRCGHLYVPESATVHDMLAHPGLAFLRRHIVAHRVMMDPAESAKEPRCSSPVEVTRSVTLRVELRDGLRATQVKGFGCTSLILADSAVEDVSVVLTQCCWTSCANVREWILSSSLKGMKLKLPNVLHLRCNSELTRISSSFPMCVDAAIMYPIHQRAVPDDFPEEWGVKQAELDDAVMKLGA
jgi:hypothetical protein